MKYQLNIFKFLETIVVFASVCLVISCKSDNKKAYTETEVANEWARMTIHLSKNTPGNTPTNASRSLGYIGLTMYESVVAGYPEYQSIAGQLNELDDLPILASQNNYNWIISLNAGQAEIHRNIYNQTSDANKLKIDSLENAIENSVFLKPSEDLTISKSFGIAVAKNIFEWSKTDGGHKGYLKNFDKTLQFIHKPGGWKPPLYAQSISHYPLHPHWGNNRTFLKANSQLSDPEFISYNENPNSAYYKLFLEVYNKNKTLTQAEKEAAIWWGDDPDETPTPPGHSYFLATMVLAQKNASLIQCAEVYAKIGMSLSDAFRNCWRWKYKYFSERPNTFITEHIDNQWESFWPDPPFPAFPSGHAIQAAAAATILADTFGPNCNIIDSTHVGRKRDEIRNVDFKSRKFTTFWEIAHETANSRFYGGIHTKQDNDAGLVKGKEIAENVLKLNWKKRK